jgi:hypothetical protein
MGTERPKAVDMMEIVQGKFSSTNLRKRSWNHFSIETTLLDVLEAFELALSLIPWWRGLNGQLILQSEHSGVWASLPFGERLC